MRSLRMITIMMVFATTMFLVINVGAQDYPTKPVKVIIPFSGGSATDTIARAVSKKLSEIWGQPVVAENVPGKGGTIGASAVAKAPPDGYTLFVYGAFAISPYFHRNLPYDPLKDFTDIAPLARQPLVLLVGPSVGIKSVSDLIRVAKSKPGQFKFGSPGTGSAAHLTAEKFRLMADINMGHVPYKGGPETVAATNSGDVIYSCLPMALAKKTVKKGKLLALAVTSAERSRAMPEVPTIAETGLAGFEFTMWWGLWAPAAIPTNIVDKIEEDVARSLATPELKKLFSKLGAEPMSMTSSDFTKFVRREMESVARIIKETGIKTK
jgi:tripartite-type tricarboxylate transporter receptor subunit TctC